MRIALVLEYDGSRYCGWQSQPSACSVQTAIEDALSQIAQEGIRIVAAGRTDSGVHASYQVVHFDTQTTRPINAWIRGTNALLPNEIAIQWAAEMPQQFHARHNAIERHYRYFLLNQAVRPGIHHRRVGWYHHPLNLTNMQMASRYLLGEHDFSSFRAAECQAKTPIRTITRIDISRQGNLLIFDLCANAFLQHMVRNIVGCLVYIGKGKYPATWMRELLANRSRIHAPPTFSPAGLYLVDIKYDAYWGMPASTTLCGIPNLIN